MEQEGGSPATLARPALAPLEEGPAAVLAARLESYRRLAEVFHAILGEHSLETLLERIADTLAILIPYDTLTIYEANESERELIPVLARDEYAAEILNSKAYFGEGITGWSVEHREPVLSNEAHLDPRVVFVPGTPPEPEALITVPLIARDSIKGALNIYRTGEHNFFSQEQVELAKRFGDAAALALDNAESRAALERLAQTDSLTGVYNHRFFHERLRSELARATRVADSVSVLMLDIDDFKRLNDIYGHAVGDQVLIGLSDMLREMVRVSDVVCRLGGEELAIIMPSSDVADAAGLAGRFMDRLTTTDFDPAGRVTVSIGIAKGPDHAVNARELANRAEEAMMTAKARGKDRVIVYEAGATERPEAGHTASRNVRSISHLKMLQSLAGKLNRLNDVREIAMTIATELRALIDYHSCRVYLAEGKDLIPVALVSALEDESPEDLHCHFGEGITGRAAQLNQSLLIADALECDFAQLIPGTEDVPESIVAVPLSYGSRVIGVIVLSSLGVDQFDEADVRLMEVLAGNASVALENARLYEAQRREAETAKALLEFSDAMANAPSIYSVGDETVKMAARLLEASQSGLWLQDELGGAFRCVAHFGYVGDPEGEPIVRQVVDRPSGERLIAERRGPFVMTPSVFEGYFEVPPGVSLRTVAIAPLHDVQGWILVRQPHMQDLHFSQESLDLLAGVAYQASVALQKTAFYKSQKENADIANALLEFGRELSVAEGLNEVLQRVVEQAARILGSPKTSVWLEEVETGDFLAEASWGYDDDELHGISGVRVPADLAREYLQSGEPFIVSPEMFESVLPRIEGAGNALNDLVYAMAPLHLDGGRVGAITAAAPALGHYEFSDRKMRLLSGIAHQARLAIANAWNFENLERTFLSTVEALANALEAKDEYTSSHARDITDMALEVGRKLRLETDALKRLELAALFHDIGKIGIPSQILLKAGPLTAAERTVVETHPELGSRILAPILRLEDVRPIVRACHERFDGRGYPDGLAGHEIPIEARIIFVCDAFHAMTTDRPYRKALETQEAHRRLREAAGTQFDPDIVEAFLAQDGAEAPSTARGRVVKQI
jgi:diguanylate cyclase (GGDEF)-like protein